MITKGYITYLFIIKVFMGCSAPQPDLAKMHFTENANTLIKDLKYEDNTDRFTPEGMKEFKIHTPIPFCFLGVDLNGEKLQGNSNDALGIVFKNSISFYFSQVDSIVKMLKINVITTKQSLKIYNEIEKLYGKALYEDDRGTNPKDTGTGDITYYWESEKENKGLLLSQVYTKNIANEEINIESLLYVFELSIEMKKRFDPREFYQ